MPLEVSASEHEIASRLTLARSLAERAGAIQRERYETALAIDTKSASIDLVTEVDRACELLIVEGIRKAMPADIILAEEGGTGATSDSDAAFRWIIDPLDGTTNFAHGFPRFCVSIGIERITHPSKSSEGPEHQREIGVVFDPLLNERFEAARGYGAWLGERRLSVTKETDFGRALVGTGFAYDVHLSDEDNLASFKNVVKTARGIRRDGSAALDLCYVAAGRLDAYWELKLHPWDVAAGYLIVEEAGGRLSDTRGGPADASGRSVVSSNGPLHEALLAQLVH